MMIRQAIDRPTPFIQTLLGRRMLVVFTLVLTYGCGLWLYLLHEAEEATEPGAPPGVIHWLRDSSLSLPLVALGVVLGAALARRLLDRCGRGAYEVVIGALVAVVLASRRCPVDRAGETVRARAHVDRTGLTPDLVVGALPEATRQD